MSNIKLILWKHDPTPTGEYPIYTRITVSRKTRYKSTGYYTKLEYWDEKNESLKKGYGPLYEKVNKLLLDIKHHAQETILDLQIAKKNITSTKVKQIITSGKTENFFLFAELVKAKYLKEGKGGTVIKVTTLLTDLKEFNGSTSLMLNEVDTEFLDSYKKWLQEKENGVNTITGKLKKIRTILNKAMVHRPPLITENPFLGYPLEFKESNKAKLTEAQLKALAKLELKKGSALYNALNAFLFSFLTWGMRFRDVILFEKDFIQNDRLFYTARKTNKDFSIEIFGKLKDIVDHYLKATEGKYLFPFITTPSSDVLELEKQIDSINVILNRNLKKIALLADVSEFTFHIARHSFADRSKKKGIDPAKSMEFLGHADYDTHKVYLSKFDTDELDQQSRKVYEGLF